MMFVRNLISMARQYALSWHQQIKCRPTDALYGRHSGSFGHFNLEVTTVVGQPWGARAFEIPIRRAP
jgi:hypothetical protein